MIKSVVLDISKNLSPPIQTFVLRQFDMSSLTLNITINEGGEVFDLANYEARFMAQLQNGKVIIDPCEKTGANMLSYTLPSALTAKPGTISLSYIAIYQNDEWVASTEAIAFYVLPGVDIGAEEAESFISEFLRLKEMFDQLIEEAEWQKTEQQASWQEQMLEQQTEFENSESQREKRLSDALAALEAFGIVSIPLADIDALWA